MKLSVVICTYNGATYIADKLKSILNQTRHIDEIVVSDDGSTDNTIETVKNVFKEECFDNYRIIINKPGKGVANNFLSALKIATGEYVFLCDQDDIWDKEKVDIFEQYIKSNHGMAYFSDGDLIDSDGNKLSGTLWEAIPFSLTMLKNQNIFSLMLNRSIVTGSAMAVSRELIAQCKLNCIPEGWIHDDFLGFIAATENSIYPIDKRLYCYRQHGNNIVGAEKLSLAQKMNKWFNSIGRMSSERTRRYKKYSSIAPYCNEIYKSELKSCIAFWKNMCMLNNASTGDAIKIIFKNREGYMKYYTGLRGQVKDLLSCL